MLNTPIPILKVIQSRDPDGMERQPTDQDYANHKRWAITHFGEMAWHEYTTANWAEWERECGD